MLFYSNKPGPGISKEEPPKTGLLLFLQILRREFFSLIKLSLLFLLFSLPVVTLPAALCAMCRITMAMVRDRPYFLWSDFWETFRSELGKATLTGVLFGAGFTACFFILRLCAGMAYDTFWVPAATATAVLMTALLIVMASFAFPMLASMDLPLRHVLKNAWLLSVLRCGHFLLALAACAALLLVGYMLLPVSLLWVAALYPALLNLITTFCAYSGIKRYVLTPEPAGRDGV